MLLEAFLFLEQTKTEKHLVNGTHLIYESNDTNIDLCNTQGTLTSTKKFLTCRINN